MVCSINFNRSSTKENEWIAILSGSGVLCKIVARKSIVKGCDAREVIVTLKNVFLIL